MYFLFHNYGSIALFLLIVAIVWIETKHSPRMLAKVAEMNAADRTSVLIVNIKSQRIMQDLKNLIPEMHATCLYNKATTKHAEVLNKKIWDEYYGQRYYLICTEHPELTQELLPFLIN